MSSKETEPEFWRVRQAVEGMWGAKCPEFDPSCGSCQTWKQFEEMAALAERGARVPEEVTTSEAVVASERSLDWIDAEADKWAEEFNLTARIKNIAHAARLNTGVPQNVRDKFAARAEASMSALCRQTFLEAWLRCIDSANTYRTALGEKE